MIKLPDPAFNAAVMTMARKVWRHGYDTSDHPSYAPAPGRPGPRYISADHYFADISERRRVTVYTGHSDNTIFGFKEIHWDFLAWHEWTHWALCAPFTLDGELDVAHRQCADLARVYGHGVRTTEWQQVIMAEVYGQALFQEAHDEFPTNPFAFDATWLRYGAETIEFYRNA